MYHPFVRNSVCSQFWGGGCLRLSLSVRNSVRGPSKANSAGLYHVVALGGGGEEGHRNCAEICEQTDVS